MSWEVEIDRRGYRWHCWRYSWRFWAAQVVVAGIAIVAVWEVKQTVVAIAQRLFP